MEPWYKIATPRKEVREGRSFNPDEFAIALERVVAGTAPEDYRDPKKFFSRTYFTRALGEHIRTVLRRLDGKTENTAPVGPPGSVEPGGEPPEPVDIKPTSTSGSVSRTLRVTGSIPPELWNRLGTKLIPKLRSGVDLKLGVDFSVTVGGELARSLEAELRQALQDLALESQITVTSTE